MKRPKYDVIPIEKLKSVVEDLFSQYDQIQIAYLYGSYAKGNQTEFSDIDIGIVLEREFKETSLYFAKLASKIEKTFNYKINIDLVILNNATPRFLYQVIKNRKVFYFKDETFKDEFELKVLNSYFDIKPLLDKFDNIYVKEVLGDEY
jgi:predicted nucleotidyltransferase